MKTQIINIRVTEEEKEKLQMEAEDVNMFLSQLIREKLFYTQYMNFPKEVTIS